MELMVGFDPQTSDPETISAALRSIRDELNEIRSGLASLDAVSGERKAHRLDELCSSLKLANIMLELVRAAQKLQQSVRERDPLLRESEQLKREKTQ